MNDLLALGDVDDVSVFGVPFFVMEQLHGRVPISFPTLAPAALRMDRNDLS